MERLTYIDSLKGIGIILVVVGHLFIPYTDYLNDPINQTVYSFHMPLFFFLSGLVYGYLPRENFMPFLIKKTITLLFPYLFFGLFYCLMMGRSWTSLLLDDELHCGYWFTLTLFFVMVLSRVMDDCINFKNQKNEIKGLIQLLFSALLMISAKIEVVPEDISSIISFDKIAKFYLFFQMGIYMMQSSRLKSIIENNIIYTILICLYLIIICKFGYSLDSVNIYSIILPLCGVPVIYNIVKKNSKMFELKGILPFLGKRSIEIYLTHFLFLFSFPHNLISGYGCIYLQVIVLLLLSFVIICISLIVSYILSYSDFLSLLLYGKGLYVNRIKDVLKSIF